MKNLLLERAARSLLVVMSALSLTAVCVQAQQINRGLTVTKINNPIETRNFAYVGFLHPLTMSNADQVTLHVQLQDGKLKISWTNGPGFELQTATVLGPEAAWKSLGTQNPQSIPIDGTARYFRAQRP